MTTPWAPTTADVAAIIPQRASREANDFTATTLPSNVQVSTNVIPGIVGEVLARVGQNLPASLYDMAKFVAAIGSAAQVEISLTQTSDHDQTSKYEQLHARYLEMLTALDKASNAILAGEDGSDATLLPVFGFPDPTTDLLPPTTFHTRF